MIINNPPITFLFFISTILRSNIYEAEDGDWREVQVKTTKSFHLKNNFIDLLMGGYFRQS